MLLPLGIASFLQFCAVSLLALSNATSGSRARLRVALILSVGVFLALSVCFRKYTIDDAYISLRYARNLAAGHGLVYSTDGSAPVEGYTNFLWIIAETPLFLLGLSDDAVLHSVKALGIAFGVGIIISTYLLVRLLTRSERVAVVAALLLSAIPQLSFWAVAGLETTMYIFWLMTGLCVYVLEGKHARPHVWSMLLFALMAMTRPEGLLFVLGILLWELTTAAVTENRVGLTRKLRSLVAGGLLFGLSYGVYFLWRLNFYGFLLPNTFYARSAAFGPAQLLGRLAQMSPFLHFLLPVVALGWFGYLRSPHPTSQEKRLLAVGLTLLGAFAFAARREWMPGFRYELPFVPILTVFSSLGIHEMLLVDPRGPRLRWRRYATTTGVLASLGLFLLYPTVDLRKNTHYTDELDRAHVALGKWLGQYAPRDASYASWDMGAVPYYSKLPRIIDIHTEGILSTHTPHSGYDVYHFLSLSPSFIVLPAEPPVTRTDGMYAFYLNREFRQSYQLIFSFALRRDYILAVHKRREVYLPQRALEEGRQLAERSLAACRPPG